jgi:hypothetical protein
MINTTELFHNLCTPYGAGFLLVILGVGIIWATRDKND